MSTPKPDDWTPATWLNCLRGCGANPSSCTKMQWQGFSRAQTEHLLNAVGRFPLSGPWIYIISENKGAEQDIGDLLSTPTSVILPDPGADPELPQWLYPNPGRGWQGRHCSVWGLLHGGALDSLQPDPAIILAWVVFSGTKE